MTADASHDVPLRDPHPALAFVALAALTGGELAIAVTGGDRDARIAALVCLLVGKAGVVLSWFMGARSNRRAARLVVVALVVAVGFAAALMADTAFRARRG